MSLRIDDRTINNILLIDDEEEVRNSYRYSVEDCDLTPIPFEGPIVSVRDFISHTISNGADAAICDHHLKVREYSTVNGAEIVAEWYKNRFPALLCTKWEAARAEEIRKYRRFIPMMINPTDLVPENIEIGLQRCIREFSGQMQSTRKPWRTLIRVEEVDDLDTPYCRVYVTVPAWDQNEVIALLHDDLPNDVKSQIRSDFRCYAEVNIGAEEEKDLYFENWEINK